MTAPFLSHREFLLERSELIRNHTDTVVSIQAVSQLLESLYQCTDIGMVKRGPKIITELWDHLDSIALSEFIFGLLSGVWTHCSYHTANIVKNGVRYHRQVRSDLAYEDKDYSTAVGGSKILTEPSDGKISFSRTLKAYLLLRRRSDHICKATGSSCYRNNSSRAGDSNGNKSSGQTWNRLS